MKSKGSLKPALADWLGIAAILIAVLVFCVQEGFPQSPEKWQRYVIVFGPIVGAVSLYALIRYILSLQMELADARDDRNIIESANIKSDIYCRIKNEDGDALWEEDVTVSIFRDGRSIRQSKKHFLETESKLQDFQPNARVRESSNPNIAVRTRILKDGNEEFVNRTTYYRYEWRYKYDPPLRGKKSFVKYTYSIVVPRSEAAAFRNGRGCFFFERRMDYVESSATLVAPDGYELQIADCFYKDCYDDQQKLEPRHHRPALDATAGKMTWELPFIKAAKLFCIYKLIRKEAQPSEARDSGHPQKTQP